LFRRAGEHAEMGGECFAVVLLHAAGGLRVIVGQFVRVYREQILGADFAAKRACDRAGSDGPATFPANMSGTQRIVFDVG
jgi:hypothetical protein